MEGGGGGGGGVTTLGAPGEVLRFDILIEVSVTSSILGIVRGILTTCASVGARLVSVSQFATWAPLATAATLTVTI